MARKGKEVYIAVLLVKARGAKIEKETNEQGIVDGSILFPRL